MSTTIAIFSVSAGAGHVRAAEALKATAELRFPGVSVIHIDLMTLAPPLFRKIYAESYQPLVERHPALWGYLYSQSDKRKLDSTIDRMRIGLERLNMQRFKDTLREIRPDYVVCTHFLPAELFSRWKRRRKFAPPVWVVVTDFDVHMLWVHKLLSGYCTANEEVAWRLRDRGVDGNIIHVTGIPIMPGFANRYSRVECAQELGIDPNKPTLLLMSGGTGMSNTASLARRLLAIEGNFQIVALAGRNARLLAELQKLERTHPGKITPMGYTNTIERVMAASDLAITKSGGLTTSECLASGLPLIVASPIPGQEERNADFLLEHGAALKAYDEAGLEFKVKSLLTNPSLLASLRENTRQLAKPDAAGRILNLILGAT